jgi:hypothetical protein
MTPAPRYAPFVYTFVPFSLLLAAGNVYAEESPNLTFGRVVATILLSATFATPAVVLFFLRDQRAASPILFRCWQLLWTFGFIGYALHFYYSVGVWFEWDFPQIWRRQGGVVVSANCALLAFWAADVAVALCGQGAGGKVGEALRWLTHVLFVVAFVTASVVFRSDGRTTASLVLGVTLVMATVGALLFRWWK